jgi:hypothetical protein
MRLNETSAIWPSILAERPAGASSDFLPAPFLERREIEPSWRQIFMEYGLAVQAKDPAGLKSAEKKIDRLAAELFRRAFIEQTAKHSEEKSQWRRFIDQMIELEISTDCVAILTTIENPDLPPEERRLLFDYATGDGETKAALAGRIKDKIISRWKESSERYNGWQSGDFFERHFAFLEVIEWLPGAGKGLLAEALNERIAEVLTLIPADEAGNLLNGPVGQLYQRIDQNSLENYQAIPGFAKKIRTGKTDFDLWAIWYARGLTDQDYYKLYLADNYPEISDTEQENMAWLLKASKTPYLLLNRQKKRFLRLTLDLLKKYLLSSGEHRGTYASMLVRVHRIAKHFNIPAREVEVLLERADSWTGFKAADKVKIERLASLRGKNQVLVTPSGLPKEIKEILDVAGYYNLVAGNITEIELTGDIKERGFSRGIDVGGTALSFPPRVRMVVCDKKGDPLPAWLLASVLVHEAAHIEWWKRAPGIMTRKTPNERHAYLTGSNFLKEYLEKMIRAKRLSVSSAEVRSIAWSMINDKMVAGAANLAMGYDAENYDSEYMEPPPLGFLRDRGLERSSEMDISGYPTYFFPLAISAWLKRTLSREAVADLDLSQLDFYFSVLSGEGKIRGYYHLADNEKVRDRMDIWLTTSGQKTQLTDQIFSDLQLSPDELISPKRDRALGGGYYYLEYTWIDLHYLMKRRMLKTERKKYLAQLSKTKPPRSDRAR